MRLPSQSEESHPSMTPAPLDVLHSAPEPWLFPEPVGAHLVLGLWFTSSLMSLVSPLLLKAHPNTSPRLLFFLKKNK